MQSNSRIELTKAWWTKERPKALAKSGDGFGRAVDQLGKSLASAERSFDARSTKEVEAALAAIASSARQVVSEASALAKTAGDPATRRELADLADMMKKPLAKELDAVRARLAELARAANAEEADAPDGDFADPAAHAAYLAGFVQKLRRKPHSFALGLPSNDPAEMRLALHPKTSGRSLAARLKSSIAAKKVTFGTASAGGPAEEGGDPEGPRTLVLTLEGRAIPSLAKRVRLMLKALGVAGFRRVKVFEAGVELAETGDETAPPETVDLDAAEPEEGSGAGTPADAADPLFAERLARLKAALRALAGPEDAGAGTRAAFEAARRKLAEALRAAADTEDLRQVAEGIARLKAAAAAPVPAQAPAAKDGPAADTPAGLARAIREVLAGLPDDALRPDERRDLEAVLRGADLPGAAPAPLADWLARVERIREDYEAALAEARRGARGLAMPRGLPPELTLPIDARKQELVALLTETDPPTLANIEAARAVIAEIRRLVLAARGMEAIERVAPETAQAALEALSAFEGRLRRGRLNPPVTEAQIAAQRNVVAGAAPADLAAERALLDAMIGWRGLREAMESGPLAPGRVRRLADADAARIVAAFETDPELAGFALEAATEAENPAAIADAIDALAARVATGFEHRGAGGAQALPPSIAMRYAEHLIVNGGSLGADYFADLEAYLDAGLHFVRDPLAMLTRVGFATHEVVPEALADTLIDVNGRLDLAAARALLDHARFAPSIADSRPAQLLRQAEATLAAIAADPARVERVLDGVAAPTDPAALALMRDVLQAGPGRQPTERETRAAVLQALLTPVIQEDVGSCFSTVAIRRLQATDPLALLEPYARLASEGRFAPANGDPEVVAVTDLPSDRVGHPLTRSLEFTVATAGARVEDSARDRAFETALDRVETRARTALGLDAAGWRDAVDAVEGLVTFTFDPTEPAGPTLDGVSMLGRVRLVRTDTSPPAEIATEAELEAVLVEALVGALGEARRGDVTALVGAPEFMAELTDRGAYRPWDLSSGGGAHTAMEVLEGGAPRYTACVPAPAGGESEGDRAVAVLAGLLDGFRGETQAMVTVVNELHAFNGLPQHPSLDPLEGATPAEVAANIERELLAPGRALRDADLPEGRAGEHYAQVVADLHRADADPGRRQMLARAEAANRPAAADRLTPAELRERIARSLAGYFDAWAAASAADWARTQPAGAQPGQAEIAAKEAELRARIERQALDGAAARLAVELGTPTAVIADSNWGDAQAAWEMVVAPDPTTGEARLWLRARPTGAMRPLGRDWLDCGWHILD